MSLVLIGRYFDIQVVHDCRNDAAALYYQYDISIKNVFDTQVMHHLLSIRFSLPILIAFLHNIAADFELGPI
jgi:ribonuclease D